MIMLIKNVNIITPYEILKGSVRIENGIIANIDLAGSLFSEDYEVLDGQGNYLSPGFIDIHNHGNSGFDIMDSTKEALDNIGEYHLSNGTTSYLATIITSSYEDTIGAIKNVKDYVNKGNRSKILGIHLEGPFINPIKKGAQPEKNIRLPNLSYMNSILENSLSWIKMVTLAPELYGALDLIEYLRKKNIIVAMGHTDANFDETKAAISSGATIATHFYNGMRLFDHRDPGIIGAVLNEDKVYCEIIYDRVHVHDEAVRIALKMKGHDKIILVSDAIRATGLSDGEYELGGQIVNVNEGIPRLNSGKLAGSTLSLRKAVYNMVTFLNIPILKAVKMASLNPAKAINMHNTIGSIEIGKRADLIVFDKDINIKEIILNGKLI